MRTVAVTAGYVSPIARKIALAAGERHVYTGNVHDKNGDTTFCPGCNAPLIVHDWYRMVDYQLVADVAGRGTFGARRIPVRITRR